MLSLIERETQYCEDVTLVYKFNAIPVKIPASFAVVEALFLLLYTRVPAHPLFLVPPIAADVPLWREIRNTNIL